MAKQEFPKMVYHKITGKHSVVQNQQELEEAFMFGCQLQPVVPAPEMSIEERYADIAAREEAVSRREEAVSKKEKVKAAR